jgi:hypothetical protein
MSRLATLAKHVAVAAIGLSTPTLTPAAGDGIRVGEGRLHPYFEVEGRYDSNVLYATTGAARTPDLILHFRPGFTLNVPGPSLAVDFDGNVDWNQYLGVSSASTKDLSRLQASATLGLGVNRQGRLGLELTDSFQRSDRTPSLSLGSAAVSNYNTLRLAVPFRPGGGALAVTVGGHWQLESFEPLLQGIQCDAAVNPSCDTALVSKYGYNEVGGNAEARWLFLPRTALVLDGGYFARIPNDTSVSLSVKGMRLWAGLAGLVTPHIAATVKGGYGDTFGSADITYRTWLANVEVEYVSQGPVGLRLGWVRDYHADPGTDLSLYGSHRIYLDGRLLMAGRIAFRASAQWERLSYARIDSSSQIARLEPSVDYELMRYLYLGAGYALTWRSSSLGNVPAFDYSKNEFYLKVRVTY